MNLKVNTIEFDGQKAVINSYSVGGIYDALIPSMNKQREEWEARFPNATVRTEDMSEADTIALVAAGNAKTERGNRYCYIVGRASEGEA